MKNKTILGICSAAAVLACVTANASPSSAIRYSLDGSSWTTIAIDEGAGDTATGAGNVGIIHVTLNVGGFNLDLIASKTYPAVGSLASPKMDLGIGGSTTGAGTIYIEFSANGFNPVPNGSFITAIAPNNDAGVTETETTRVSSSPDDSLFGAGTSFASIGPVNGVHQTGSGAAPGLGSPYSITIQDKIVATGAGLIVSQDDRLSVPDGGNTLMLLGSALSVLGLGFFRTRKAVKA